MKRISQIYSTEVGYDEFQAIARGRQRYVILSGDPAFDLEPGDFIELIEKLDQDMKEREPDRCVVQITDVSGHTSALDDESKIFSISRVTDVALRLRAAQPMQRPA